MLDSVDQHMEAWGWFPFVKRLDLSNNTVQNAEEIVTCKRVYKRLMQGDQIEATDSLLLIALGP